MTPEDYHSSLPFGSGEIRAYLKSPDLFKRRLYLRWKDLAGRNGARVIHPRLRDFDMLAERSRATGTAAMRAGAMLEAYLFAGPMGEEIDWAEEGASPKEIANAKNEADFVRRFPDLFPNVHLVLARWSAGEMETQVTVAALLAGVACKGRIDLLWGEDALVECDVKRYAGFPPWETAEDVVELARKRGAIHQRAIYKMLLDKNRGGDCRSAILAVDPPRERDLLVEIPQHFMQAAADDVEQALDGIPSAVEELLRLMAGRT
jgi:hypothetical protein